MEVVLRRPQAADIPQLHALLVACDLADFGTADYAIEIEEVFTELNLEEDAWLVITGEQVIGLGYLEERGAGRLDGYVFVHPDFKGRGIGSRLLDLLEERAGAYQADCVRKDIPFEFNNVIPSTNPSARQIVEKRQYQWKSQYSVMQVTFADQPAPPQLPVAWVIRPVQDGRDETLIYQLYLETFRDARGFRHRSYDEWREEKALDSYDRSLWFIAERGGEPAGFILCKHSPSCLWIDLLGVKREFRKQGVGHALLQHVFAQGFRKGWPSFGLSVDNHSPTQASHVYEKAGMTRVFSVEVYGKTFC